MSVFMNGHSRVPPGFRFHPTDEELVGYYLQKKVMSRKIDLDVIRDIDLYKLEPWDLQERCKIGSAEQTECYFFSHKDKKYPTGTRTNRATTAGFWKATGRDKAIHTNFKLIGMRKTLVFYKGRAPNGEKTDWIMHEYRLEDENSSSTNGGNEDGWVVCRVFKKRTSQKTYQRESAACLYEEQNVLFPDVDSPKKLMINREMASYHHQFLCKQEMHLDDFNTYHDPFSQMPQLESPKVGNHASLSCPLKGLICGTVMRPENHPPRLSLECEIDDHERIEDSKSEMQNFNNKPVTDWRMVDRLAASQLSQEIAMKDPMRYNSGDSTGNNAELRDHDVALLMRMSKEQQLPQEFNAGSCEGDLWSFGR
ncbi:hypothetical protein O6H91_11G047100 [Diphasiastrum complanatum]|uniref:Uncharacterized protein n=3 Tax=Diphasiastrum complanatum TaxID=34168 RepID=A0ACC2C8R0_DIPCM|nr:hypothetical protein O6H91_11G047100 [Diphasiastrum complanatum]KAJ7538422.1 hypothetical protein O6H91_11G047100 [Diphasiastrum complanatum]KAJ7538423.1 hypothetical protein O6H91_11G047100 [Diphasiastrum complanatum]